MNEAKKNGNNGEGQAGEAKATPAVPLPEQKGFFKIPARFGHVPVAEEPLGYDKERRFEHHYPRIELPFQVVDVVKTGAEKLGEKTEMLPQGRNRLFFGDCLHVMRMLPSESIDLIYIDPPFFSGRNYNVIFGDKNEVRSFSDIWEGGMPGYLVWLNARLYEMKRLLTPTGSIYVHVDWHAVHYVKVELDKIFGYDRFVNEVIWKYSQGGKSKEHWARKHDTILFYSKESNFYFDNTSVRTPFTPHKRSSSGSYGGRMGTNEEGRPYVEKWGTGKKKLYRYYLDEGKVPEDVWEIQSIQAGAYERIGYPTQKPEELLEWIINASSKRNAVIADFFCGGGTTLAVAQKHGRQWVGCDISRVAVALTADRIARILSPNLDDLRRDKKSAKLKKGEGLFEEIIESPALTSVENAKKRAVELSLLREIGYSVEHWGIYEINRLTKLSSEEFRAFVLACYGARKWTGADPNIHGVKGNELLWVAESKETDVITAPDVKEFAQAVMKSRKPEERQAVMIGWSIDPKARAYADQVMTMGDQKPIQFIKLRLWPLAGEEFKGHVTKRHDKYKDFFAFILPPDIPRIGITHLSKLKYRFDVSEARSMNTGGKIVNVQWDFDFRDGIFSATQGYQLCRKEKKGRGEGGFEGEMIVEYSFEDVSPGTEVAIACRVQDDVGGEGLKMMKLTVE